MGLAGYPVPYGQHMPTFVRYLHRRLGDLGAESAALEVFTRACNEQRAGADRDGALRWLYATATDVISERHRVEQRRLRGLERHAAAVSRSDQPTVRGTEIDPRLVVTLRTLREQDRDALLLIAWGGLSDVEAAEILGIPVDTVRSRVTRVRRRLDLAPTADHAIGTAPQSATLMYESDELDMVMRTRDVLAHADLGLEPSEQTKTMMRIRSFLAAQTGADRFARPVRASSLRSRRVGGWPTSGVRRAHPSA